MVGISRDGVCLIEGCENPRRSRGWCNAHYQRWQRYGDPTHVHVRDPSTYKTRPRRYSLDARPCRDCKKVKSADHFHKRQDGGLYPYCKDCMRVRNKISQRKSYRRNNPPRPTLPEGTICSFEGCDDLATSAKFVLCRAHYLQQWRGEELRPIIRRAGKAKIEGTDEFRLCTNCEKVQPTDEFYVRPSGNRQTQCKTCMTDNNRFNYLMRERRFPEALAKAQAMLGRLREKNEGIALDAIKKEATDDGAHT